MKSQISNLKSQNYSLKRKTLHFALCALHSSPRRAGFTLVELLVVVAIGALSMALLFPNFIGARQRARDSQRKRDLLEMQKALELYKLDQSTPVYPTTGAFGASECATCWSSGADCTGNIYLRKIPCDPRTLTPTPYIYARDASDSLKYAFSACLENTIDPDRDASPNASCTMLPAASYTVNEP